jgi:hypothetical protein
MDVFNDKIDSRITMAQRIVALLRDLVLIVVAILTSFIIYYGGDPGKLNTLDWTKLVIGAFSIILLPFLVFFVSMITSNFILGCIRDFHSIILPVFFPITDGPFISLIKNTRLKDKFILFIDTYKKEQIDYINNYPMIGGIMKYIYRFLHSFYGLLFNPKIQSYMSAIISFVALIIVFYKVIFDYIKPEVSKQIIDLML